MSPLGLYILQSAEAATFGLVVGFVAWKLWELWEDMSVHR